MPARVSSTSLVSVARNRYSVPCVWAGHRVSVRLYPDRIVIVADQRVVAEHAHAVDRHRVVYDWQHYLPLIAREPCPGQFSPSRDGQFSVSANTSGHQVR